MIAARFTTFASLLLVALLARSASAEHFAIELSVQPPKGEKATAFADTSNAQRPQGFKPRPVCHAKAGEELTFQFFVTSNFPHDAIKNVTIHYYIVPEAKTAQDAVPKRDEAILQGHFTMDFKPQTGKVGIASADQDRQGGDVSGSRGIGKQRHGSRTFLGD